MTIDEEPSVLACHRVADIEPKAQSIIVACDACGAAIWLANSSPATTERVCLQCLPARIGDNAVSVEPPTLKQWADIKKVGGRR